MSARVMTVTDAIAVSKGSALRDAVTITWVRSKTSSCAMQINGQLAGSSAAKRKSLTCQLLHALHARWGWSGATGKEETDVRYRRASQTVWHRPARAAHCVSRPVSGLASGSLSLETAPSHARSTVVCRGLGLAYRCVGSAGIAFVWRMRTGFPFHPKGAFCAPGTPETGGTLRGCIQACKLASSGPRAGGRRLSGTAAVTRQPS